MFFQDKVSRDFPLLTIIKLMKGEITGEKIINITKREITINHKVSNQTVLDMITKEIVQTSTVMKMLIPHLTNEISILI